MAAVLRRIVVGLACAWLALHAWPARACDTPVFRYALEHWPPSPYQAVIFHKGPLSDADKAVVARLRHAGDGEMAANIEVTAADTSRPLGSELEAIRKANPGTSLPWVVVLYPAEAGIRTPAWAGPLASPELGRLLHSAKRQEIVRQLGQGNVAVCLILESGDRARDAAAEKKVRECLRKVQAQMAPPPPVDAPAADGDDASAPAALPVRFSTMRISRNDPGERVFVRLLTGTDPSLARATEPILFPVFGQGRMLCALAGKQISDLNLEDVAAFLLGSCSCEVKQQNPGVDLLMTANWYAVLAGQPGEGPTLPSLATLPEPAATSVPAAAVPPAKPAVTPSSAAKPAARATRAIPPVAAPAKPAKPALRPAQRVKPKVTVAGAAARLKAQRAAEQRAAQAKAAKATPAVKPATAKGAPARVAARPNGAAAPAGLRPAAPAVPTDMKSVAAGPAVPTDMKSVAAGPAGRASSSRTQAPPSSEGRSAEGSEQRISYPLSPRAEQPAAASGPAADGATVPPPSNNRLIAGAGIALLLGLALAAVAPRILAKRARGPRRPA